MSKHEEVVYGTKYEPGVYKLKEFIDKDTEIKNYELELVSKFLPEEEDKFGDRCRFILNRVWKTYLAYGRTGIGALFSGNPGMGKTDVLYSIGNKSIEDGMMVVNIKEIKPTLEMISFLDRLGNATIILDEFEKNFDRNMQEHMLTFFSTSSHSKIRLLSANNTYLISNFLLNRPGRLLFHFKFKRLEEKFVDDYCKHHGVKETFFKDLKKAYKKSATFNIDYIKHIVKMHKIFPEDNFKELVADLNTDLANSIAMIKVIKIEDNIPKKELTKEEAAKDAKEKMEFIHKQASLPPQEREMPYIDYNRIDTIEYEQFLRGRMIWIYPNTDNSFKLEKSLITDIDEENGIVTCVHDTKKIIMEIYTNEE